MWEVAYTLNGSNGMMLVCVEKSTDEIPAIMEKAGFGGAKITDIRIPYPLRAMMKKQEEK